MSPGDIVIVLKDPLGFGFGRIDGVMSDGRLLVVFEEEDDEEDTVPLGGVFDAHDLELADVWMRAA